MFPNSRYSNVEEFEQYIHDHKINDLIKECIISLTIDRPEDPIVYIRDYFDELHKKSLMSSDSRKCSSEINAQDEATDSLSQPIKMKGRIRRGAVSAEVYSEEDMKAYVKQVIPKDEETTKVITKCLSNNLLFKHLDDTELNDIYDAMFLSNFSTDDVIMNQGDEGDNFYVINTGTVDIIVNNVKVTTITDGSSFGELALIYGTPRAATVIAKSDITLFGIDRMSYRKILM
ncbi:cAMP-dependent protein kinase type I-beta regulatory subunit, partial [Intoshia linei]